MSSVGDPSYNSLRGRVYTCVQVRGETNRSNAMPPKRRRGGGEGGRGRRRTGNDAAAGGAGTAAVLNCPVCNTSLKDAEGGVAAAHAALHVCMPCGNGEVSTK